jgi:cytochrome P450
MAATVAPYSLGGRLAAFVGEQVFRHIDFLFGIARSLFPILVVRWGGRTYALVTRYDDVQELMLRNEVFNVIYAPKIKVIMDGGIFFLGGDDAEVKRDKSLMRQTAPAAEALSKVKPEVERLAEEVVAQAPGRIDLAMELTQQVTTRFFTAYFGTPAPDLKRFSDQARLLFRFTFADPGNDPALLAQVQPVAAEMRAFVEAAIRERKLKRGVNDDILERCLQLQDSDPQTVTDLWIRNNLIGLIVGAMPQPPMLLPKLVNVLLDRPQELAAAQAAAGSGDDALLSKYVFEASRFDPLAIVLLRECARDYTLAKGTPRAKQIAAGTQMLSGVRSAMFDGRRVASPRDFRIDRPPSNYFHFGFGPHECFGVHMDRVMIPAICKAILQRKNLRRAAGAAGQLQMDGPFPTSLVVQFDN